jgi:type IV secretory pathway VirB10-like protein
LQRLIRQEWEHQKFFPLPIATKLSQQFAHYGLQFFKVNKTVTHVSVARPQFLDLATTPVSENIKRIVEFINANPKCTRRKLIETLAPTPKKTIIETKPDTTPAPAAEGEGASAPAPAQPEKPAKPAEPEATPEQTAVLVDLHWLIHQGAVLEFADGRMETAKKPAPRPPKPEKKAEKLAAEGEAVVATETAPQAEATAEPVAEVSTPAEQTTVTTEAPPAVESVPASEPPNQIASEPPVS